MYCSKARLLPNVEENPEDCGNLHYVRVSSVYLLGIKK